MSKKDFDVIVVGAGFAGMYTLYRLRKMGLTAKAFETGSDVGGTWYWNRYPGARVDVESMQYSYQFDNALQQEWEWSQRYSPQPEILRYARHVAERYDLRRDIQFNTRVTSAHFEDAAGIWAVTTDDGKTTRADFFVTAVGCLSSFNKPDIPGLDDFKGNTYFTGSWPHEPVDFTGQEVAVIGTGSTAMQSSPEIAKQAKNVTLFQRTPNYSIPSHNGPQDPEYVAYVKANYPRLRAEAKQVYGGVLDDFGEREGKSTPPEVMEKELQRRWERGGLTFLGGYTDSMYDKATNEFAAEFVRKKIRSIVKDPETAELLCPTNEIGVKRICVDTGYFQIFNRDNVHLKDIRNTPIDRIVQNGIQRGGVVQEFDSIVYATGFDAFTGSYLRMDIRGRDGVALKDHWEAGPRNYIGMAITGFPNMFTVTGPLSPSVFTNMLPSIEMSVEWITDAIGHVRDRDCELIEATPEAEDEWVRHCDEVARPSLRYHADCWYLGSNIPGKPRVFMPYNAGLPAYARKCDEVVANDYKGFAMS
ncbi:flavin-containing monooxygenase [Pseudooceanicola aestuarii]|uniref:flavin-containing monooxygenase n=1 Tax=Pseudooceanicola aestuarii TaxID=2697319 RepID=UPI0013D0C179|nr:NAD(P)/FAD-dependent oxidoreductase [Pseudooceanicola aestuarii]